MDFYFSQWNVNGKLRSKTTFWNFLSFLCSSSFVFYELIKVLKRRVKITRYSVIIKMAVHLDTNLGVLRLLVTIISNFYSRHYLWQIIENIDFIDKKVKYSKNKNDLLTFVGFQFLKNFNFRINHSRELLGSILLLVGYPIIYFLLNFFLAYLHNFSYSVDFGYRVLIYLPLSNTSLFIWILILVCKRIKSFRKLLTKGNVNSCLILFDKFWFLIQLTNKYFGILLMFLVLEKMFHSIIFFFSLYNLVANDSTSSDIFYLFMSLLYNLIETISVLCIFLCSHFIKVEIKKFVSKFQKIKIDSKTIKTNHLSNLQFGHQDITLSCGLFDINWKFLFAVISSIFSYIIILVQFDIADSFKYLETRKNIKNLTEKLQF